ncbi:DUF3800 domain-containing protein [Dongia sp.]|uniref:DUF3800 domain-containing protein n=1 Tax=Dongia sp. TaxID=1977262 RepID=UPI0035AFB367
MHIYIDESGTFLPAPGKDVSFSCVGAVAIAGRNFGRLEADFSKLSATWPKENGEIKGKLLNEPEIADLCKLLASYRVILEAVVIDMNWHTEGEIDYHQKRQAEEIMEHADDTLHPSMIATMKSLQETCLRLPRQLYVQQVLLTTLTWEILEKAMLFWVQRWPGELAKFLWVIDAKDKTPTEYEKWWHMCVKPFLQAQSVDRPFTFLKGADYSAFHRNFPARPVPKHLPRPEGNTTARRSHGSDFGKILNRDLVFGQSHQYIGLQIADILTNALRRALSGRLQPEGWLPIRNLLIRGKTAGIRYIGLTRNRVDPSWVGDPVPRMLAKGMLVMVPE